MRRKNVKNNKTKYNLNHKIHEKYYIFIVIFTSSSFKSSKLTNLLAAALLFNVKRPSHILEKYDYHDI